MKIQLDFNQKIITIESNVNLYEFTKRIKQILPDWKDWSLNNSSSIIYWNNPIVWDYHTPYIPSYPPTYCTSGNLTVTDNTTVHCLDLN